MPSSLGMPPASRGPAFVGVDWGTTALRLWVFAADGRVLAERRGTEGMGTLQPEGFAPVLDAHLAALAVPDDVPVLLCGMVGAKTGWLMAPYVTTPCTVATLAGGAVCVPFQRDARILPGLATEAPPDVMRGEETKLAGLLLTEPHAGGLVCLAGTHAKWVRLAQGHVTAFRTTMAGELFALLTTHSTLRLSLAPGDTSKVTHDHPEFRAGLRDAMAHPGHYASQLFGLRAGALLDGKDGVAVAARLSGLLLGAAATDGLGLDPDTSAPVRLIADGRLAPLYEAALVAAGRRAVRVDADTLVQRGLIAAARTLWPAKLTA